MSKYIHRTKFVSPSQIVSKMHWHGLPCGFHTINRVYACSHREHSSQAKEVFKPCDTVQWDPTRYTIRINRFLVDICRVPLDIVSETQQYYKVYIILLHNTCSATSARTVMVEYNKFNGMRIGPCVKCIVYKYILRTFGMVSVFTEFSETTSRAHTFVCVWVCASACTCVSAFT